MQGFFGNQCSLINAIYAMRYVICYHLYNLKSVKNTHGGALLLVPLQFTESDAPSWFFFMFFKILQIVANCAKHPIFELIQVANQTLFSQTLI